MRTRTVPAIAPRSGGEVIPGNRTPQQIAQARARVLAGSPEPRPLSPGKTLEDVIVGQLADDRSEAEILAALEEIS